MAKVKNTGTALTLEQKLEQALVADWEQPYKVPDNWCWTTLKSISNLYNGDRGSNYPSKKDYVSEGVPFINAGAIQNNTLDDTEFNYITQQKYDTLRAGKIQKNDILYCLRGSLGKTAIIETDMTGAISSSLCIIRAKRDVQPKYLAYLLRTGLVAQQQEIAENGSAQPNLSAASVMEYKLPISPLNEQQRIVDRIERMFSKLDEVKENVQNVIDGFENRKSAILHKAFNGELTAKWREENGKTTDEWHNECLRNLLYPMQTKKPTGEIFRYIDIDSIDNKCQKVKVPKIIPVSEAPSRASRAVKKDSVLFSMVRPYLKNIAIISEELSDCISSTGFYVCDCKEEILPLFLYELLRSDDAINYLMQFMKGDNSPSIRKDDLLGMKILLPTIEEQVEIVRILTGFLSKEQQAKENAEEVLERIELIKKSILARAFRGELGTNNPDEESSLELLKSVLSEEKDEKHVTKPRSKRVSIPTETKAMLSNHLEKDILKLFYKSEADEVSIDDIMSVSANKFEIMDALKALEEKKLISKKANGIYKLAR